MELVLVMILPMLTMTGCDLRDLFGGKDEAKRVSSIVLTKGIKTEYNIGDEIDFNGAKLLLRYEDDTEVEITLTTDLVSGFNTATFGNRTMKISYKGKERSVNYKVAFKLTDNKWCISFATNGQEWNGIFQKRITL